MFFFENKLHQESIIIILKNAHCCLTDQLLKIIHTTEIFVFTAPGRPITQRASSKSNFIELNSYQTSVTILHNNYILFL